MFPVMSTIFLTLYQAEVRPLELTGGIEQMSEP